jgi:hypothetical protein
VGSSIASEVDCGIYTNVGRGNFLIYFNVRGIGASYKIFFILGCSFNNGSNLDFI